MSAESAARLDAKLAAASLYDVVHHALETLGDGVRIACSFGVEDMVVLHETARAAEALAVTPRVFLLDTGRLHQETYDLIDRARERYRIAIEVYTPSAPLLESLLRTKGPNSFLASVDNRHECCSVRKLEPLSRALSGADGWVTGLRREQAASRADVRVVEFDQANGGILKFNPLAHWTSAQVWQFARTHHVPTHALHARGYPSIGCAPCTRAVEANEDPRAGRWWWERADHKECGLHPRRE